MTDSELLYYYGERTRIINGGQRSPGHQRLLDLGYIEEHPVSLRNVLVTVTSAGQAVLDYNPVAAASGFIAVSRALHASASLAAAAESAER
jgi:hypothetical protein